MGRIKAAFREGAGCFLLLVILATWCVMAGCTAIVILRAL